MRAIAGSAIVQKGVGRPQVELSGRQFSRGNNETSSRNDGQGGLQWKKRDPM
jgi:hypothetical protein